MYEKRGKTVKVRDFTTLYCSKLLGKKINLELAACPARTSVYLLTRILTLVSGHILTTANTLTP